MAIDKSMKAVATGAFRAGWAAACMTIADECAQNGGPDAAELAAYFRRMAGNPANVEVGDLATPEGQAMRATSEVVMHERVEIEPAAPRAAKEPSP